MSNQKFRRFVRHTAVTVAALLGGTSTAIAVASASADDNVWMQFDHG